MIATGTTERHTRVARPIRPVERRRHPSGTTWRVEAAKLCHQGWVIGVAALCVAGPVVFVIGLHAQGAVPQDTLFGRWVHTSGLAIPLVVLGFTGQWVLPALGGLVAGDIFAAEDHHGTWKTILTRSHTRSQVFAGKALAAVSFSLGAVMLLATSSVVAGLASGTEPVVGLTGQLVPAGRALPLVLASWGVTLAPTVVFAAVGLFLSVVTRSRPVGMAGPLVLGLAFQLVSLVDLPWAVQAFLPITAFQSWHGFWTSPSFVAPFLEGVVTSAAWTIVLVVGAFAVFRRRDIAVT